MTEPDWKNREIFLEKLRASMGIVLKGMVIAIAAVMFVLAIPRACIGVVGPDGTRPASWPDVFRFRGWDWPLPESIPDTPENIMRAILAPSPKREDEWKYRKREDD